MPSNDVSLVTCGGNLRQPCKKTHSIFNYTAFHQIGPPIITARIDSTTILLVLAGDCPGSLVGQLKPRQLVRDLVAVERLDDDRAVDEDGVGHVEADRENTLVQELQIATSRLDRYRRVPENEIKG